jgi:hypothetical protein
LYGAHDAAELAQLNFKLLMAGSGQAVVARTAILGSYTPLRRCPSFDEHSLKCGIERAFFHLQNVVGKLLNAFGNLEPVQLTVAGQHAEDKHVERAGRDLVA